MPIHPEALIKQIDRLWAGLADGTEGEERALVRACSLTLIVLADSEENEAHVSETLAELTQAYPSRAIVVRVSPGGDHRLEADVRAHCWMPMGKRQQICSEQIEVEASERSLSDLPSVLLPLIVPDLPVVLWCRSKRALSLPVFEELVALAPRLILDVERLGDARKGLSSLAERTSRGVTTDLSWTRLTRWREMVAQVFENSACRETLPRFSRAAVSYRGESEAAIPVSAFLIAGWLINGLQWRPQVAPGASGNGQALQLVRGGGDARLEFAFAGSGGSGSHLQKLELTAADDAALRITLERNKEHLDLQVSEKKDKMFGTRVWFPPSQDLALLSEELKIFEHDRVFESSLETAARVAGLLG